MSAYPKLFSHSLRLFYRLTAFFHDPMSSTSPEFGSKSPAFGLRSCRLCGRSNSDTNDTGLLRSSHVAAELTPAIGSSLVATLCAIASDRPIILSTGPASFQDQNYRLESFDINDAAHRADFIYWELPPGVLLFACLALGACVSSFIYRHQRRNAQQSMYFATSLLGFGVIGRMEQVRMDMFLLTYVPWALCAAMLASPCGHALQEMATAKAKVRRRKSRRDEKIALIA
ncbi:hypothetical protein BD289DRAFT_428752 [Coniella lustricola]|uniref:Uncharacterized protein n=1 Tax=Coniella lustricola TaxID=2025994 RepID=A0A2T3ADL4_9PEZI|nr:hypothetical protein BD289DRAFT_428752 [Coniella lustricola]